VPCCQHLKTWRDTRDRFAEQAFFGIYGSPALQTAVGLDSASTQPLRRPTKDILHQELLQTRIAELKARMSVGGVRDAAVRALLYVGGARNAVDEHEFEIVRRIRHEPLVSPSLSLPEFKALAREQFYMLLIDRDAALAAIPKMLPENADKRRQALDIVKRVLTAGGPLSGEEQTRCAQITQLFDAGDGAAGVANVIPLSPTNPKAQNKPS
jgi:hypothetical protein